MQNKLWPTYVEEDPLFLHVKAGDSQASRPKSAMTCAEAEWEAHLSPLCIHQGARGISHNTSEALAEALEVLPNLPPHEFVLGSCHSPWGILQQFKLLRAAQQTVHFTRRTPMPASYSKI